MITIVVALSISTFLLGFAALAVDLGTAYTRKAELRSIADRLALAGASGLPTVPGALAEINRTLRTICPDEAVPGVCNTDENPAVAPDPSWATDGDEANGEVDFYRDPDGDGRYRPGDRVSSDGSTEATAVRVRLARSTVEFGLASALGVDSATLTRSATGRIGTPLGAGLLPFALTPDDLADGQFCVREPGPDPADPRIPAPTGFPRVGLRFSSTIPGGVPSSSPDPVTLEISLTQRSRSGPQNVVFHFLNSAPDAEPVISSDPVYRRGSRPRTWQVTVPVGGPGSTAQVWATGTQDGRPFVTPTGLVTYTGDLPPGSDLCEQPAAKRGPAQLARSDGDADALEQNIRSGPEVRLYPTGLLGPIGDRLNCAATGFPAASSCLSITGSPFSAALTSAFLNDGKTGPGRMLGDCGNGTTMSHSRTGVDDSHLFTDPGFITVDGHFSPSELRSRITDGRPADPQDRGWLTSRALTCPRLAVMPVIDPATLVGSIGGQSITSFRYVWIDDENDIGHRGLNGDGSRITSFRGYVVDPGYLPALVSGSRTVGPFLGGDMPKEAMLITDLTG